MWSNFEEKQCLRLVEMTDAEFSNVFLLNDPKLGKLSLRCIAGVACRRGNLEILMMCANCGLDIQTARVSPLRVPLLSIAAMFDHSSVVRYLLYQGCCVHDSDNWKRTPFHFLSLELKLQTCLAIS